MNIDVEFIHHSIMFRELIMDAIRVCRKSEGRGDTPREGTMFGPKDTKLVKWCIDHGHTSVLEHVNFTFRLHISTVAHKQLIRHRIASYSAESQRTVKPTDFYIPSEIESNTKALDLYMEMMTLAASAYQKLQDLGMSIEAARYVLPQASSGDIIVTMNLRSLRNAIAERTCRGANEEIKKVFRKIKQMIAQIDPLLVYKVEKCYTCPEKCEMMFK